MKYGWLLILLIPLAYAQVQIGPGEPPLAVSIAPKAGPSTAPAVANLSNVWNTTDQGPLTAVGQINHSLLNQLAWSVAGHTFDTDLDVGEFDIYTTNLNVTQNLSVGINTTDNGYITINGPQKEGTFGAELTIYAKTDGTGGMAQLYDKSGVLAQQFGGGAFNIANEKDFRMWEGDTNSSGYKWLEINGGDRIMNMNGSINLTGIGIYYGNGSGLTDLPQQYNNPFDQSLNTTDAPKFLWYDYDTTNQSLIVGDVASPLDQYNTIVGYNAGLLMGSTLGRQTLIGRGAGYNTLGDYLTALGYSAGYQSNGDLVVAIGYEAARNSDGDYIVAIGDSAAQDAVQSLNTVAIGRNSFYQVNGTSVTGLAAVGRNTGVGTTSGYQSEGAFNTYIGFEAGRSAWGDYNNCIGESSCEGAEGNRMGITGYYAGYLTNQNYSVGAGYWALRQATGQNNLALGYLSGYLSSGSQFVGLGQYAARNFTGTGSVFIGSSAGQDSTAASSVGIGQNSLFNNTGSSNVGIGYYTLRDTSGGSNVAIGTQAGENINNETSNVLIGRYAGYQTKSSNSVFIGRDAGRNATNDYNVGLGYHAGLNSIASESVYLGRDAGEDNTENNRLLVGNQDENAEYLLYGDFLNNRLGIGVSAGNSPTRELEVNGSARLMNDNDKLYLGDGEDASISFDGTSMIFDTDLTGSLNNFTFGDVGTFTIDERLHPGAPIPGFEFTTLTAQSWGGAVNLGMINKGMYTYSFFDDINQLCFLDDGLLNFCFNRNQSTVGNFSLTSNNDNASFEVYPNTYYKASFQADEDAFFAKNITVNSIIYANGMINNSYANGKATVCVNGTTGKLYSNDKGCKGTASEKSWAFKSPSGGNGIFYWGGYYDWATGGNDFNPSVNFGTANAAYAAHISFICAAGATDTVINVSGTRINDEGTRTPGDSQTVSLTDGSAGAYFETSKKWIGQVSIVKLSGTDRDCNYGWSKYWDNNNQNFTVTGLETTWLGGANDNGANIELLHHKDTGWTYSAAGTPTEPTPIASMNTDHVTETEIVNSENGAWKRSNLNTFVQGGSAEGTIIKITTTANKAFDLGNFIMRIET